MILSALPQARRGGSFRAAAGPPLACQGTASAVPFTPQKCPCPRCRRLAMAATPHQPIAEAAGGSLLSIWTHQAR